LYLSETYQTDESQTDAKPELSFAEIAYQTSNGIPEDKLRDKFLAYLSYYVLVFVACTVFIPIQTAQVFAKTTEYLPFISNKQIERKVEPMVTSTQPFSKSYNWTLRPGS